MKSIASNPTRNALRFGRKTNRRAPVVDSPVAADLPIEMAKFWKSARDRSHSIVVAIRQYEGHIFLDCRVYGTNADGQSVPTPKGVTIGMARLGEFLKAVEKGHAKAVELGLIEGEK